MGGVTPTLIRSLPEEGPASAKPRPVLRFVHASSFACVGGGPLPRVKCARAHAIRAGPRFARPIAPVRGRQAPGTPLPSVPDSVCSPVTTENEKAAPEAASPNASYHTFPSVKPAGLRSAGDRPPHAPNPALQHRHPMKTPARLRPRPPNNTPRARLEGWCSDWMIPLSAIGLR